MERTPHVKIVKQETEKPQVHSPGKASAENLPFEKFWTIDDYYKYLMSTNSYETEEGHYAEIVKCDKVGDKILLLYKTPVEIKTFTPYRIAVIFVDNGSLMRNEVAVFTNKNSAMNAYCGRLIFFQNSTYSQPAIEIYDKDIPF